MDKVSRRNLLGMAIGLVAGAAFGLVVGRSAGAALESDFAEVQLPPIKPSASGETGYSGFIAVPLKGSYRTVARGVR